MKLQSVLIRGFAPLINLLVDFVNLFIKRDEKVVLCGAWMGLKFADNSRFLFQYLYDQKDRYNLKKVIWVTRNEKTHSIMNGLGYEVYMMHSLKSIYYHFKAGLYIICNIEFNVAGHNGDTMGHLAGHSVKINTWHGIPLKAGKSTGENMRNAGIKGYIKYCLRTSRLFCTLFTPGHWDKAYYLSTGKECTKRCAIFQGIPVDRFIESGYPRNCKSIKLLPDEEIVLSYIKNNKVILYVPTFREKSEVVHPLSDDKFVKYIIESGYLWIEKPHTADKCNAQKIINTNAFLYLPSDFDINVILPEISLLITDYSSICFDAIAFDKPVLYYAPDYERYLMQERGFLCDYIGFVAKNLSVTIEEIKLHIDYFFNNNNYNAYTLSQIKKLKKDMFDNLLFTHEDIVSRINEQTQVFN